MKTPLKLLVIEDRSADFRPLERQLVQHGLEAECQLVASVPDLDAALGNAWDVVLFNHSEPDMDYRPILAKIHARWPSLPVLFIFSNLAEETAVEMLQLGVRDFIPKDHLARLVPAIRRALHEVDQQHALKATEQALRKSEHRLRLVQEAAHVAICDWNVQTGGLDWTEEMETLYGYAPGTFLGNYEAFRDRVHPDDLADVKRQLDEAVAAHLSFDFEFRLLLPSGTVRWVNYKGAANYDEHGVLSHIHGIQMDITDRKQAELALAEREIQYQAVIETAADGFWMLDEQGCILAINDAYARRSGYSREELLTMKITDLEALESPEEVRAHIKHVQRDGSDLFETRHRAKDGEVWPAEVKATYWAAAGGRFFGFLRDITERKRTEVELRALHTEMEQLMRFHVAGQTVAAITHELNQPLNAVTSYTEAALRLLRAGNPQPDKLKHALESSAQQAQRAGRVARNLLAFMKQGDVQTEPVDINKIVRGAMSRIEANIYGAFQVRLELEPYLAKVRANRLQVEKVLVNLIENGIEAMRDAGVNPLDITITVRACTDGSMAQVTVCDRGPGVDAQTLHRIFDPFFTTKPKGLGMGLSISLAIIEAHGGRLWVDSESASGSSFHFTLPFAA